MHVFSDGDKESDGPSESGDNTSESTQGGSSEPAQEKGINNYIPWCKKTYH